MNDFNQLVAYLLVNYWWYVVLCIIGGIAIQSFRKMSRNIHDIEEYKSIQDVINKYGPPDNIQEYGDYQKYTFKKSTYGFGWNKYKVHIFTLQNGKILKHETFQE